MPDGWKDGAAPALRRIAEGQYHAGDSDPRKEGANWLRAIMGLKGQAEPTGPRPFDALRSSESVDVTARENAHDSGPSNMDEIYLGTRTAPPTGTYTPPAGAPPTIDPKAAAAWKRVIARYPFAGRFVSEVTEAPTLSALGDFRDGGKIRLRHGDDDASLLHELTHATADHQFTTNEAELQNYYAGGGSKDYANRRGERVARVVARDAEQRGNREYHDSQEQRMKRAEELYINYNGPKPPWIK
jgi:hypothetical protein